MTTTDQIIDELVGLTHGCSDQRTQHNYKVHLQILVETAKREAAQEILYEAGRAKHLH